MEKYNNEFYNEKTKNEYYNYHYEDYQKKIDNLHTSPQRYNGETSACQFNWQFNYLYMIDNVQKKLKKYLSYNLFKEYYKNTDYKFYFGYEICPKCNKFFSNYQHKGKKVHRNCGVLVKINNGQLYYFEYTLN